MSSFLSSILRTELIVSGFVLIIIGLALRGFFSRPEYRERRKATLIFAATTLLLILLTIATAGKFFDPLMTVEGSLIDPAAAWGKETAEWISNRIGPISQGVIILTLVLTLFLSAWKRKKALPFLLLLYSLAFGLIGGILLNRGRLDWGITFLGLACLYCWSCGFLSRKTTLPHPPSGLSGTRGYLLLAGIIVLAFLLRTYQLGEVSFRFDNWEADYGLEALREIAGRHKISLWLDTQWRGLGHSNFSPIYTYLVVLFFRIFGPTIISLKLVSVTWGMFGVYFAYEIMRILFGKRLALLTAFFLAVSPLHINYSRVGLLLGPTLTAGLLIIYLLLRVVHLQRTLSFILLAFVASFAGYLYSPIKFPILLSGVIIAVYIFTKRGFLFRNWVGILSMAFIALLIMAAFNIPALDLMAPSFCGYESVWHRTQSHLHTVKPDYLRAIPLIWENFHKLSITLFSNRNFNYNPYPKGNLYFHPLFPVLLLLGLAYSLANFKKANYRFLLFFSLAFLLPNLLSRPPVVVRRTMMAWPFLYCLAAIPVSQLIKKTYELLGKGGGRIITVLVIAGLLSIGAFNCHVFFGSNQSAGQWEKERSFDERAQSLLDNYFLYVIPYSHYSRRTIDFILADKVARGIGRYQYLSSQDIRQPNKTNLASKLPAAFICAPNQVDISDLVKLKQGLKGGRIEKVHDKFGQLIAYLLLVESQDAAAKWSPTGKPVAPPHSSAEPAEAYPPSFPTELRRIP